MNENVPHPDGALCPFCGSPTPNVEHLQQHIRQALGEAVCRRVGLISLPPGLKLSVVVPVYNEHDTVRTILDRIKAVPVPKEIIVVDDYSTDGRSEERRVGKECRL